MAEAILSNLAGEILKKLCSLAFQEIGQWWWGVHDELDKLKDTVSTIQSVLLDAEKQPTMSEQRKNYIENLKEALYDADDLLDDFSTEVLRLQVMSGNKMAKEVRIFFSPSNQLIYGLKMGSNIKAIRKKLDAIKTDKEFHIGECDVGTRKRMQTHSYIPLEEVVGRKGDKEEIRKLLLGSNFEENVLIIPIVGMGGLGKTTLSQFLYNDEEVKNHFELKIWVCVSDVFDVKIIVEKIIESVTNRKLENFEMDMLQNCLRKELNGKKYLLVLDDVWNEDFEKWHSLKILLMGGARGSRIVVTTRSQRVAEITSKISPYLLKGLSEIESWSLFARMAFGEGKEPTNENIVAIGKEIVKKCVGVPLAIRMMGSLLYSKKLEDEWTFLNIELLRLPQPEGGILPTLMLSYNHLEPHLKHCFAYCSLFPKDHKIDVKTLIYLWIGQGVIKSSNSRQSLEQIGYEYFLSLLWRSFFQEPEEDELGNIVCCKMHDLMHDLAVEVAGKESTMISSDTENIPKNTRHLSIDFRFDISRKIPVPSLEAKKARTFLLTKGLWCSDEQIWSHASLLKFRRLRMLDLHGLGIRRLPRSIGKLKHLRHLDLSNNSIEMLPSSIGRLKNLLVLKLSYCWRLKEFPREIGKLVSLTLLEFDGCNSLTHMPQGLGKLTSLQKLTKFVVANDQSVSKHCGGLNELNGLNNLRELRFENLKHVKNTDSEYGAANLEGKELLQSLIFHWRHPDEDTCVDAMSMEGLLPHRNLRKLSVLQYPGVKSPSWLSSLPNLFNLELFECQKVKHLPPLEGLSSLRHLSIKGLTDLEYIDCNRLNCSGVTFFSSLEELKIRDCPNLKGWRIMSTEAAATTSSSSSMTELPPFPCLSKLEIEDCSSLTSMPLFPSIKGELYLHNASKKLLKQTMMMKLKAASTSTSSSSSPPLPLSNLKSVRIEWIEDLEYLPDQGMRNLTSLESLQIGSCHRLLSLAGEGFSGLTSLCSLEIYGCQRLKSISQVLQHCTALEKLFIQRCEELDFSDSMQWQGPRRLSSLEIGQLPQLVSLPEGLQHVTTLKSLKISYCKRLRTLSPVLEHLTALEELQIWRCNKLDLSDIGIQFQDSRSLQLLSLGYIPKLVSLPEWLQHCTTLQVLCIYACNELTTLPNWIGSLTSLQQLQIQFVSKTSSLPEGMRNQTSLQELKIGDCPQLSERCGNNMGVDWPKIAHIPNIEIDYETIQSRGRYQLR